MTDAGRDMIRHQIPPGNRPQMDAPTEPKVRLSNPRIVVVMRDGAVFDITALNADLLAYERDAAKHKWPKGEDAPMGWLNYLAWHNLTKTEPQLPPMTLKDFEDGVRGFGHPDDLEQVTDMDPTNPEAGPE